jgi:hypothetical protein
MNTKVNESKLISGKEALIALANGDNVESKKIGLVKRDDISWLDTPKTRQLTVLDFISGQWHFRLKPKTITINGIEVPAPFKPKDGDRVWFICDDADLGYAKSEAYGCDIKSFYGWWRTEEEIKQVVAALRQVFGGSHDN